MITTRRKKGNSTVFRSGEGQFNTSEDRTSGGYRDMRYTNSNSTRSTATRILAEVNPRKKILDYRQYLYQRFEVDNSLPVLNAGLFLSAISGFQIFRMPPCLLLQRLMGNHDVNARLDVLKYNVV